MLAKTTTPTPLFLHEPKSSSSPNTTSLPLPPRQQQENSGERQHPPAWSRAMPSLLFRPLPTASPPAAIHHGQYQSSKKRILQPPLGSRGEHGGDGMTPDAIEARRNGIQPDAIEAKPTPKTTPTIYMRSLPPIPSTRRPAAPPESGEERGGGRSWRSTLNWLRERIRIADQHSSQQINF